MRSLDATQNILTNLHLHQLSFHIKKINELVANKLRYTFGFGEISKIGKQAERAGNLGKKLEWQIWYIFCQTQLQSSRPS